MKKTKLIFTKNTVGFIIEALGYHKDEKGYVVNADNEYALDADGKKFKSNNLIGAVKGYWFTSEEQIKRTFPSPSDNFYII